MINSHHPEADRISKAAAYLDRVKQYCRRYIVAAYEERQSCFSSMKDVCDEFTVFTSQQFPDKLDRITTQLDKLRAEIEVLQSIDIRPDEGCCSVCNTPLKKTDTMIDDEQLRYILLCEACPRQILICVEELETLTGVVWI